MNSGRNWEFWRCLLSYRHLSQNIITQINKGRPILCHGLHFFPTKYQEFKLICWFKCSDLHKKSIWVYYVKGERYRLFNSCCAEPESQCHKYSVPSPEAHLAYWMCDFQDVLQQITKASLKQVTFIMQRSAAEEWHHSHIPLCVTSHPDLEVNNCSFSCHWF